MSETGISRFTNLFVSANRFSNKSVFFANPSEQRHRYYAAGFLTVAAEQSSSPVHYSGEELNYVHDKFNFDFVAYDRVTDVWMATEHYRFS